jgi:death-associated protein kinase
VKSHSMVFEPGLTKGMLEVFVAPSYHLHCSANDQSTKAIDIQNTYLNCTCHRQPTPPRQGPLIAL